MAKVPEIPKALRGILDQYRQKPIPEPLKDITERRREEVIRDRKTTSPKIELKDFETEMPKSLETFDPRLGMFVSTKPQDQFGTSIVTRTPTAREQERFRDIQIRGGIFDRPVSEISRDVKLDRERGKDFERLSVDLGKQEERLGELEEEVGGRIKELSGNIEGEYWTGSEKDLKEYNKLIDKYNKEIQKYEESVGKITDLKGVREEGGQLFFEPEKIGVKLPLGKKTLFEVPAQELTAKTELGTYGQLAIFGVREGASWGEKKVGEGFGIMSGTLFDITGKQEVTSPRYFGKRVGDIVRDPSILKDKLKFRGEPDVVYDLATGEARLPTQLDLEDKPKEIPSGFTLGREQVVKGAEFVGETGVGVGKYFIPYAGLGFFGADVEGELKQFDYKPIEFAKARPVEAGLLGGVLVGAGALRGARALRKPQLTPLQESQIMLQRTETESARLMREREKLLSGLKWGEDPTKGVIKREPFTYVGLGERTLTGKESIAFLEGATGTVIKTKDVPKVTIDVGLYQQPIKRFRLTQDMGFPKLKESAFLEKPIEQTSFLFAGTTKLGKDTVGLGTAYQIGARGQIIDRQIVSLKGKQTKKGFDTLFQVFEPARKSRKTVRAGEETFILEAFPTGRLVGREQVKSRILQTIKEDGIISRRIITDRKEIPTKAKRLFEDDFLKALQEKPTKGFGYKRTGEIIEDVISPMAKRPDIKIDIAGVDGLAVGTTKLQIKEPFIQIARGKEIPEGMKFIEGLEKQRIIKTTGKPSSPEYFQSLYQQQKVIPKLEALPMPTLKPKLVTKKVEPLSKVVETPRTESIWAGTGLYERTEGVSAMAIGGLALGTTRTDQIIRPVTFTVQPEQVRLETQQDIKVFQEVKPDTRLRPATSFRIDAKPKVTIKEMTRLKERTALKERLATRQVQRQALRQALRTTTTTKLAPKTPKKPKKPKTRFIKFPKAKDSKDKLFEEIEEEDFKVFVRKKGEDIDVGDFKTLPEAKKGLFKTLREEIRASGFIQKKGEPIKVDLIGTEFKKSKIDPWRVVEPRERRIKRGTREASQLLQARKKGGFF